MTVQELIEELGNYSPDKEVELHIYGKGLCEIAGIEENRFAVGIHDQKED